MPPVRRSSSSVSGTTFTTTGTNERTLEELPQSKPVAQSPFTMDSAESLGLTPKGLAAALPTLKPVSAAAMLKALGDGQASIDVPLKPGSYSIRGVGFTIKPGTVVRLHAEVKNGELLSVGRGARGTSLRIEPPVDLPLWITGRGVELTGPAAHQQFETELGGFFDLTFQARKLNELVTGQVQQPAAPTPTPTPASEAKSTQNSSKPSEVATLAASLIDLENVKVDATLTLRDRTLDLGGPRVQVDSATTFNLKGDGRRATLTGHVSLDGFGVHEGNLKLTSRGGGRADLVASLFHNGAGYRVESKLSNVELSIDRIEGALASAAVPGQTDRISLGPSEVHGSTVTWSTNLELDGLRVTPTRPELSLDLNGSGTVNDLQLNFKDTDGAAHFAASGGWKGRIQTGPSSVKVDLDLTQGHFDVRDLQQALGQRSKISIDHATADGDVHIAAANDSVQVDGKVRSLDVLVDDYRGGGADARVDLEHASVMGSGELHIGTDIGFQARGRFHGEASFESVEYRDRRSRNVASLGHSSAQGDFTNIDLSHGTNLRVENVAVSLDVRDTAFDVGRTTVRGGGKISGEGTVVLDSSGFSLDGNSQLSMTLADGRVRSSTVDLKMGKGSKAHLLFSELHLGKTASHVEVREGTRIDAVLTGGSMKVRGQTVQLARGGRAELTVKQADYTKPGTPLLRGSVLVDAPLQANLQGLKAAGVKVHATDASGRVKVSVDDVQLANDQLTLDGVDASLDANIGHYAGVKNAGEPGLGSLKDPIAVLSVADVQATTAVAMTGLTPPEQSAPVEALKFLREGELKLGVPLSGSLNVLGSEVKIPSNARVELALAVKDGRLVADQSRVNVLGFKPGGFEALGAHLDEDFRVFVDLRVSGRTVSVTIPHFKVPADMETLATLASGRRGTGGGGSSNLAELVDLTHARLDVSNAVFTRGPIPLPGGVVEVSEGSRLSFHGTPLAGELTGAVGLEAVTVARDDFAMDGGPGRAELAVKWQRQGDRATVEGKLSNLAVESRVLARKARNGDYVSLGAGRLSGASLQFESDVVVDERGLPKRHVRPELKRADVQVGSFTGQLFGARRTAARGTAEVARSQIDGSLTFSTEAGLTLKARLDEVDAQVSEVSLQRAGRNVEVEHARLAGRGGRIDFSQSRVAVDAQQLAWDATVREVSTPTRRGSAQVGQVHISGEGRFDYDSERDLRLTGKLSVEASDGEVRVAKAVTVNRKTGVAVE